MITNESYFKQKPFPRPMPAWLENLESLDYLPIRDVLTDSVYYPASGLDGYMIEQHGGYAHSFVYVTNDVRREEYYRDINGFPGYDLLFSREVEKKELCSEPFKPFKLPSDKRERSLYKDILNPYFGIGPCAWAVWAVYERKIDPFYGPENTTNLYFFTAPPKPKRFSVLYIKGDGVAAYQAL